MADGRVRDEWTRTSSVMALIYNMNRDPKAPALGPSDFDPQAKPVVPIKSPITVLKDVFINGIVPGDSA